MPESLELQVASIRDKAKALFQQGRLAESLEAHDQALKLAPDAVAIYLSAAKIAHLLEQQQRSLRYFEEAARLDPRCYPAIEAARRICIGAGIGNRAQHYSRLAHALDPTADKLLSLKLFVPAINESPEEIREARAAYSRALDELLAMPPHLDSPQGAIGISAFFLSYHGENDRDLQVRTARLFLQAIPSLEYLAPHCGGTRPAKVGRIRIGFISRFFAAHPIQSASIGLIEHLARERFELFVLRINPSRNDAESARVRAAAEHTIELDADIYRAREQIAALSLDILFYQDIGMEQTSYFLAFARLAPVQCTYFGHPNTTGIPTMDYFISSDLLEVPEAAAHYSERLILLRDLPTLAYCDRPQLRPESPRRDSLGLPDDATLYVCPQTLYKLHPDFDRILQGILDRDARGLLVLIAGQFEEYTNRLRARFARQMPTLAQRIVFLPYLPFDRYMQLLRCADVVLDTVPVNGMTSSLHAFATGAPVVTMSGVFQRGRFTQAMYRKMGIDECIASDAQTYIEISVRIANDREYAAGLRQRILARHHVLYEDPRVIDEFARFFVRAVDDAR